MNGMSDTSSESFLALLTPSVNMHICSMVTWTVLSYPSITIPPLSPTSSMSIPALSHRDAKA